MTVLIDVNDLSMSYGPIEVLKRLTFSVTTGESLVIIGPNGSGKTTLFRALTGEVAPSGGAVHLSGKDITHLPVHERVRLGFGRTFQVARTYPSYTVAENILVSAEVMDMGRKSWRIAPSLTAQRKVQQTAAEVGLGDKLDMPAVLLSHGDRKRLEIATTLALGPRILLMDEPTAGMSPAERQISLELIRRVRIERGLTILLTEHDMDVVFGLADRIMVLNYGEIVSVGKVEEIRADPKVRELYLGKGAGGA